MMNSGKILSKGNTCPKHSKSKIYSVSTHVPTIKCHEEVMSKLSSCTNEECIGDPGSCVDQVCPHRKQNNRRDPKVRTVTSKCKLGLHQSVSAPGSRLAKQRHKDLHLKTVRSKSTPIVQTGRPNLEDSIDFIPVKLTSVNDYKQRPIKKINHNIETKLSKGKTSKFDRPTWDEILRNNLEVVSKPNKRSPKKSLKSDNNCYSEHSSSSTPKKKVSLKETENCLEQDDDRLHCWKQPSEFSKSGEFCKSEKPPILQHVNSSDPIKTLDFLIKQLRDGLERQSQKDSLQNIIIDIENALLKIPVDNKPHSDHPVIGEKYEKVLHGAPQSEISSCSHDKFRTKHLDIQQLEQNLERSCRFLQSLCIKQKESCSNHLREKEQLSLQLAESRRLLAVSKSKEKNYEVTIGDLRLKLQEANTKKDQLMQSLQDVEKRNASLIEENKAVSSLKESLKRSSVRLKQVAREKEKLQSILSLKDLEIEKLRVLLQVKSSQNNDMKEYNDHLPNLAVEISDEEKDLSVKSLSTVTSWSERPGLICSSQASSTPRHSPSPYNSWQHISTIVQHPFTTADINRELINICQDLKKKSEQIEPLQLELQNPSSCSSLWSDKDAIVSKPIYSDGESGSFSS